MGMNVDLFGGDYDNFTSADAGAADNDVLYTSGDVSKKNYHVIQNKDTVVVDVEASVDGTTFTLVHVSDTRAAFGDSHVATIPGGEIGILRGKFKKIRVLQAAAGTIEAGNVLIAHGVE